MDAIKTYAMTKAQKDNRIPFVGVFFVNGSAKLYRAYNQDDHCLLRPINSDDLKETKEKCCDENDITISTVASVQQHIHYDEYELRPINKFSRIDSD